MTKNGHIILDFIAEATCHPTAEEIYHQMHEKGIVMSVATVYNNLNNLVNDGSIRRISIPNQPERYDNVRRHDHLICIKCGKVTDLFMKDHTKEFEKAANESIEGYELQLFHICKECK